MWKWNNGWKQTHKDSKSSVADKITDTIQLGEGDSKSMVK